MIDTLDDAMKALQAMVFGGELYDPDHPSVRIQGRRAHELLSRILQESEQIRILAIEDRLVFGNGTLPSSQELLSGLFGRLVERGIDSICFKRGLECSELVQIFAQRDDGSDQSRDMSSTTHIRLGHVRDVAEPARTTIPVDHSVEADDPGRCAPMLEEIWRRLDGRDDRLVGDSLCHVVAEISVAASATGGTLLPLGSIKHHDEYTFVHTINVAILSSALGEAVGLAGDALQDLIGAALLHDIGKLSVPRQLLNKSGKLTDSEMNIIRRHPVIGAGMLMGVPNVPDLALIVAYEHHMALDGSGYPRVEPPWRLTTASQIVQIADIYDALRSHRPYRRALPPDESLQILADRAGRCFDKCLFDEFVDNVVSRAQSVDGLRGE